MGSVSRVGFLSKFKRKKTAKKDSKDIRQSTAKHLEEARRHYNLGFNYGKEGKHDQAIREFKQVIELSPTYRDAHSNLGTSYAATGKYDQAIREFKQAIELDPNDGKTHLGLATVYFVIDRFDLAWKHARIAENLGAPSHMIAQLISELRKVSREP
jgi:Tfp pilus assembly protein PilF